MSYIMRWQNIHYPNEILKQNMATTEIKCAFLCLSEELCNGYGYHTDGRCELYKVHRWDLVGVGESEGGWVVYGEADTDDNNPKN